MENVENVGFVITENPKPVGYWCLYDGYPRVQFMMYQKPTDEQIKNTTALLGWIWKDEE
jgi:hypothetical protein